jgi:hypothetical protein
VTPAQLKRFRDHIAANRQPIDRHPWSRHEHPRGWNDALDFVERTIREVTGEEMATADAYIEGRKA